MKKLAVNLLRKEPAYRREAFEKGLKRLGYTITYDTRIRPAGFDDLLVLWNRKAGAEEKMAEEWERMGGTVLVTENAYLQKVDKTTYAISTHQHNGAGWFPVDQAERRFDKLGYTLKDWHEQGEYVLVCGQRGVGSKLMASPVQWGEKRVKELERKGVKTKLRAHPGNFAPKVPLLNDLARAVVVNIWSSSAGVLALIEGIRVDYFAPHWICDAPANRVDQLNRMAHGQWSVVEIESGEPFARMRAENWGPRTWA